MPPKVAGDQKRRTGARRKVTLACVSCREKKIRCDGKKPICGPCEKRSYRIDQCLYNPDNARTASRDEYFQTLHHRIRELEDACLLAGVCVDSPMDLRAQRELHSELNRHGEIPVETSSLTMAVSTSLEQPDNRIATTTCLGVGIPPEQPVLARSNLTVGKTTECSPDVGSYESPMFDDGEAHVTGMGQITAPDVECRRQSSRVQFYGSSSTASLMRFAWQSMPSRPANASSADVTSSTLQDTFTEYRFDDFALPPRTLADHLVRCFFDHVYTLYPFFHRPAFEAAYRNLWLAEDEPKIPLTDLRIGLGSAAESGPRSIAFHAALNCIFALGCQFADIEEVESVANAFFLRSKPPLPPPNDSEMSRQDPSTEPSLLSFYIEAIRLNDILDRILSDVYYAWCGRTRQDGSQASTKSLGGLGTMLEIERDLTLFEANLPSCLKWHPDSPDLNSDRNMNQAIAQQRNVLHARYVHLHLLLHRPMFTQLYSERVRQHEPSGITGSRESWTAHGSAYRNTLYFSIANKSATACVMAAIDLTHLVHETYRTNATDAWWYNGFF
ncbi:hypothetical protein AbraIFM66951_006242 [Aspergillus brasiliensis]|nr:hypothetical protein AbraIFM66951_006242 [Aspergillus brasiliensis]